MLTFLSAWQVCYAPFDLKNANVFVQDGFGVTVAGGSEETPKVKTAASEDATSIQIEQLNVAAPVGGRFEVVGSTDTIHTITAATVAVADVNEVQTLDLDDASAGTFTLTFRGATTDPIAFDATSATVEDALEALPTIGVGNVTVAAGSDHVITFGGTLAALSLPLIVLDDTGLTATAPTLVRTTQGTKNGFTTTAVSFTPGLAGNVSALATITLLPVQLEIKLGEGNVEFNETRELEYFLDRGRLDTVREGDEQPLELSFSATWEFIKSLPGATTPTFKEAIQGTGPAEAWYSSAEDACEPYAVDIVIVQAPDAECSSTLGVETITLEDFRWTDFGHSAEDGELSVEGSCNRTRALVERVLA